MENDEKVHCISVLIENVLYRRLLATDEDDKLSYMEKQEAKKKYIKEFIENIPKAYKGVENLEEIVKTVLTRMKQDIEWEEKIDVSNKNQKPQANLKNNNKEER